MGLEDESPMGRVYVIVMRVLLVLFLAPAILILVYAIVPPPLTPLMAIRLTEGYGMHKDWAPLSQISPHLQRAVIASEDAKFCQHSGFDWQAVDSALARNQKRRTRIHGASTISMQTSKNLMLWPGRTFLRKGAEAFVTVWLEAFLSKRRILELYLNIIEWGPGIYGAEAAAQHYFRVPAAKLTREQAARLAVVLPRPLSWRPDAPGPGTRARAATIEARMADVTLGKSGPCR